MIPLRVTLCSSVEEALTDLHRVVPNLSEWIGCRRWAGLSGVSNIVVSVLDSAVLEKTPDYAILVAMVEAKGSEGEREVRGRFFLPLVFTRDLGHDDFLEIRCQDGSFAVMEAERTREYNLRILRGLRRGEEIKTRKGAIKFLLKERLILPRHIETQLLGKGDTTNFVTKIEGEGASLVLKTYKAVAEENPEPEVLEILAEAKFANTPKLLGEVLYYAGRPMVVSVLESYEENVGDGIQPFLKDLTEGICALQAEAEKKTFSEKALERFVKRKVNNLVLRYSLTSLGQTIAELHNAFANSTKPSFQSEKIAQEDIEGWVEGIRANLDYCLRTIPELKRADMPRLTRKTLAFFAQQIEARKKEIENNLSMLNAMLGMLKMRTHQDLHLAQLLSQKAEHGFHFLIIDFEGDPQRTGDARRRKEPPLRDLGTMARSFGYVKNFALAKAFKGLPYSEAASLAAYLGVRNVVRSPELDSMLKEHVWSYLSAYANAWERTAEETLVSSYLSRYAELGASYISKEPHTDAWLKLMIGLWKMEKAFLEVRYEFDHRPQNVVIPMEGLLSSISQKVSLLELT